MWSVEVSSIGIQLNCHEIFVADDYGHCLSIKEHGLLRYSALVGMPISGRFPSLDFLQSLSTGQLFIIPTDQTSQSWTLCGKSGVSHDGSVHFHVWLDCLVKGSRGIFIAPTDQHFCTGDRIHNFQIKIENSVSLLEQKSNNGS